MKVSYSWLKNYLNCDLDPEAVAKILTSTGLEVEGAETSESIKGGLKGLVVGEGIYLLTRNNLGHFSVLN